MGIRHLKIFKTVCEEGSVTKAAQKLYMTQPAVSHAIKELETEKGFPLFDRISGRLHLTGGGKAMLEKTIALLGLYGEIESISPGSRHDSLIRIGSCITAACYWLPAILQGFRSAPTHKNIRIAAQVAAADGVIGMLKANSIDIALLEGP
jgi:molybdate transport repressor ModE-like protein